MHDDRLDLGQEVTYNSEDGSVAAASRQFGGGFGGGFSFGGSTPSPSLVHASNSSLEFKLIWDSSVGSMGSKEAAFMTAVKNVALYYSSLFTETSYAHGQFGSTPEVINIHVGWGEVNGQALPSNALGASETNGYITDWGTVTSHLPGYSFNATNEAAVKGASFFISSAEAKGFGLIPANYSATDGYIGFGSGLPWYFGDSSTTGKVTGGTAGQFQLGSVAQHEISEVMGRIGMEGTATYNGAPLYTPLDLFNFTTGSWNGTQATLALSTESSGGSYFSHDNGKTIDGYFNGGNNGGDIADWASYSWPSASGTGLTGGYQDSYDAYGYPNMSGVTGSDLSHADYYVLETLGVHPTGIAIA